MLTGHLDIFFYEMASQVFSFFPPFSYGIVGPVFITPMFFKNNILNTTCLSAAYFSIFSSYCAAFSPLHPHGIFG